MPPQVFNMYKKTEGLVLSRNRFGESHAYVKILTKEGIITFLGHGIMSTKNKSFTACQPYTFSEFVLKVSGENISLSSADTITHLIKQGIDFERLSLANYLISLASDTAFDTEDAESILSLVCHALKNAGKPDVPTDIIKAVYEIKLTAALGFLPDLTSCIVCGKEKTAGFFIPSEGGIICPDCSFNEREDGIKVSLELTKGITHLLTLPPKEAFGIRFADETMKNSFITIAERFSLEHLDCAIGALKFYKDNLKNY